LVNKHVHKNYPKNRVLRVIDVMSQFYLSTKCFFRPLTSLSRFFNSFLMSASVQFEYFSAIFRKRRPVTKKLTINDVVIKTLPVQTLAAPSVEYFVPLPHCVILCFLGSTFSPHHPLLTLFNPSHLYHPAPHFLTSSHFFAPQPNVTSPP